MTYISQLSDFTLYLEKYFMCKHPTFSIISQNDLKFDHEINVGHSDMYFTVQ